MITSLGRYDRVRVCLPSDNRSAKCGVPFVGRHPIGRARGIFPLSDTLTGRMREYPQPGRDTMRKTERQSHSTVPGKT
eukprot:1195090-Prorocentrum_minimum.AAC.1